MQNEMWYSPSTNLISDFRNSKLPSLWNFFFGVIIWCLTGRNSSHKKAKLRPYSILANLYYNLKVDYTSLLWDEFTTYINHAKKGMMWEHPNQCLCEGEHPYWVHVRWNIPTNMCTFLSFFKGFCHIEFSCRHKVYLSHLNTSLIIVYSFVIRLK